MIVKEACVDSLERAILAENNGADRIELCSRLDLDGLSPTPDLIKSTCKSLKIPIMVMVRLRGGNFMYTDEELDEMIQYVKQIKFYSISGFVFGALTKENWPDINVTKQIVDAAGDLDVTFHKAIDATPDPVESSKMLGQTGITRILTSGRKDTAEDGIEVINNMAAGDINILAAGKITSNNLPLLQEKLNVTEFHGKKIVGDIYSV